MSWLTKIYLGEISYRKSRGKKSSSELCLDIFGPFSREIV